MTEGISRRHALGTAAIVGLGLPALAACSGGNDPVARDPAAARTGSPTGPATPEGPVVLATTGEVPVGGAKFLSDPNVVITQPTAGDFHAFDRTCTHAGCPVQDIVDGKIHCACHGSLYDMTTGANVGGPAPSPLATVDIVVKGGKIEEA